MSATFKDLNAKLDVTLFDSTIEELETSISQKASKALVSSSADGLMSKSDKSKLDGVQASANNYSHPTTAGNKHIPSGGSAGQYLKWSSSGTALWNTLENISSGLTSSYLEANKGQALLNSTASKGSHVAIAKINSQNGYFTSVGNRDYMGVHYTRESTVSSNTSSIDYVVRLLDESGNSLFPGTVQATKLTSRSGSEANITLECSTRNVGMYLNSNNFGFHDWENSRTFFRYNFEAKRLELMADTVNINGKKSVVMENYEYNYKIRGGSGLTGADGYITFSW